MSERDNYPPGVPCWVDNLVPDPATATAFYGDLLGWEFDGPGPGDYYVAKLRGRDVAGVGQAGTKVGEALRSENQLADDEQRPPLADQIEGARDAAGISVGPHAGQSIA